MTRRVRLFSFILAAAALAAGCGFQGKWYWALLFVVMALAGGLCSLKPALKNLWEAASLGWFVLFITGAAVGVVVGLSSLLMLASILASLAYWDLDSFQRRLELVKADEATLKLEKNHLRKLLIVLSVGLVVSLVGLSLQLKLSFGWAVVLSLGIFASLGWGIEALRKIMRA